MFRVLEAWDWVCIETESTVSVCIRCFHHLLSWSGSHFLYPPLQLNSRFIQSCSLTWVSSYSFDLTSVLSFFLTPPSPWPTHKKHTDKCKKMHSLRNRRLFFKYRMKLHSNLDNVCLCLLLFMLLQENESSASKQFIEYRRPHTTIKPETENWNPEAQLWLPPQSWLSSHNCTSWRVSFFLFNSNFTNGCISVH